MSLDAGTRLGPYEIGAPIGAGGMGEVYRARDTKLDRDVAIKVLPEEFAKEEERLARFEREAKLLASLNHPNIASIHGFEESDGVQALVLELVEGPTLAERIEEGPIPVDEAVAIAKQIAEALEAGHEAGVIHRDLKPANIKLKEDGTVKVLDYGLAKALEGEAATPGDSELSQSPTIERQGTQIGVILGTAAYMSPEQAKGKRVDKRGDIWAFGAVFFEMLTGKKMVGGETVSDTLASVIKDEPDWSSLPTQCPGHVRALLHRCLVKDPKLRLRDIGEVRIAVNETADHPSAETTPPTRRWQRILPWAVAALALVAALAQRSLRPIDSPPVTRFVVDLPTDEVIPRNAGMPLALSADGAFMVYAAQKANEPTRLVLRPMNSLEDEAIVGTEGGDQPFFSADGNWLGFFASGEMKRVAISGGAADTLATFGEPPGGATWGADDRILFARQSSQGLFWVSAADGTSGILASPDASDHDSFDRRPEILPGGQAVLLESGEAIAAQRLDTGERKIVVQDGTSPHYLSSGHLVYHRAGTLMAAPFDRHRLEISGTPVAVIEGISSWGHFRGGAHFAVSATGTLAYIPGTAEGSARTMVWVDRQGVADPVPAAPRDYEYPRLSPDGGRLAVAIAGRDIWTYDIRRDALARLTLAGAGMTVAPVWSPDSKRIAFLSGRGGSTNAFWRMSDGSGGAERLTTHDHLTAPSSFSPDGQLLALTENNPESGRDIWVLNLADRETHPFLSTRYEETAATFSPDGKWMAYASNESGRREVYVQPYPGPGGKWQISTDGGQEPVWNPRGNELFYRSGRSMMAVAIDTESGFTPGTPQRLFDGPYMPSVYSFANYDVSPDGQRFLMLKRVGTGDVTQITVVLNWDEELKRLVPSDN